MTRPSSTNDCPICKRVETVISVDPMLKERLSGNELQSLVQKVQDAILNKDIVKDIMNDIRGVNMTGNDEKYVITKATFQDFYETQDVLVSIIQKMADRIEKQDQVLMKFGAALSEIIAKDMMGMEGMYGQPSMPAEPSVPSEESMGEDLIESEESVPQVENELGEAVESLGEAKEDIEESEEALSGMEEPSIPGGMASKPEMSPIAMAHDKALFEAGWKAHEAEMKKQVGVAIKPAEFKESAPRTTATATVQSQQTNQNGGTVVQKTLSDEDLGKMSPHDLNQWLKENKLF
jgi:hypothetical protein